MTTIGRLCSSLAAPIAGAVDITRSEAAIIDRDLHIGIVRLTRQ